MKGKFLLSLAGVLLPAAIMVQPGAAQVAKPTQSAPTVDFSRYEAYAAFAYLIAFGLQHLLAPRFEPVNLHKN